MCVSGMTCGGERTNESDEQHVYLQQICGACISRKLMTCIQSAPFRHVVARRGAQGNRPPECGALWKVAQLGKRARATARQAAGWVAPGPRTLAWGLTSRKSAFCARAVAQNAPFRHVVARRGAQGNRPPGCGALWKVAQLGKRARATARQAAGGLRQVIPSPCEVRTTTAHYRFARS